jgi:hypothetical protein
LKASITLLLVTLAGSAVLEGAELLKTGCVGKLDVSRALAEDAATSGARTPVDMAAVAAPSPAMKRRRPGDLGAPADSQVLAVSSGCVLFWLLEISRAMN